MKKLFIHIGTGKTGTTAIQQFLSDNDDLLKKSNINYCISGRTEINHHLLTNNYPDQTKSNYKKAINSLRKEIQNSNNQIFIISSEYFPGNSKDDIKELYSAVKDLCEINVIVYLRRQDEFVESWFAQIVKALRTNTTITNLLNDLERDEILDYENLIKNWDMDEIKVNMIVKIYDKKEFKDGNVVNDFLDIFKLENISKGNNTLSKKINASISREQVFFKQEVEDYCDDQQLKMLSIPINLKEKSKYFLSPQERHEILIKYQNKNNNIAKKYINRHNLFLNLDIDKDWEPINLLEGNFLLKLLLLIHKNKSYTILREPIFNYFLVKYYSSTDYDERLYYEFFLTFLTIDKRIS